MTEKYLISQGTVAQKSVTDGQTDQGGWLLELLYATKNRWRLEKLEVVEVVEVLDIWYWKQFPPPGCWLPAPANQRKMKIPCPVLVWSEVQWGGEEREEVTKYDYYYEYDQPHCCTGMVGGNYLLINWYSSCYITLLMFLPGPQLTININISSTHNTMMFSNLGFFLNLFPIFAVHFINYLFVIINDFPKKAWTHFDYRWSYIIEDENKVTPVSTRGSSNKTDRGKEMQVLCLLREWSENLKFWKFSFIISFICWNISIWQSSPLSLVQVRRGFALICWILIKEFLHQVSFMP